MASVNVPSQASQSTPPLQKLAVQSSFIGALEYDAANLTLTTHLKDGAVYQHKFVLPSEWTALQTARSPGKHWASTIRGKKLSVRVKSAKAPNSEIKTGRK